MSSRSIFFALLFAVVLGILWQAPAYAQATRTLVDDVNPCSRTAPCNTFAGAISNTAAGGILASGTNGIVINAGSTDKIIIRNLVISGASASNAANGINGISFLAGRGLLLDRVVIGQFTTTGIDVAQTQNSTLVLKNVTVTQAGVGIKTTTTTGGVSGTFDDVLITDSTSHGLEVVDNTVLILRGFNASRNGGDGVHSDAANVDITVLGGVAQGNNFGFNAVAGIIRIHGATMTNNNTNLSTNVLSDGTNLSTGNTTTNSPTPGAFTIN